MSEGGVEPFGGFCQNSVGDTFITFTFIGEVAFDEIGSLESNGGGDIVVAKYDESSWLWLQQAGGTGDELVNGCVEGNGLDIQVFGALEGNATFGQDYTETGLMHFRQILQQTVPGTASMSRVVPDMRCLTLHIELQQGLRSMLA